MDMFTAVVLQSFLVKIRDAFYKCQITPGWMRQTFSWLQSEHENIDWHNGSDLVRCKDEARG